MSQQTKRLTYFSVLLYLITGRRAYRGGPESLAGFLRLTTTGRKSGQPRTVDLLYIRDGSAYVLTASGGGQRHPAWYLNLQSNPRVTIDVHGSHLPAGAEVAGPDKRKELWARLIEIAPLYLGHEKRTQREIPMVLVRPLDGADAAETR